MIVSSNTSPVKHAPEKYLPHVDTSCEACDSQMYNHNSCEKGDNQPEANASLGMLQHANSVHLLIFPNFLSV